MSAGIIILIVVLIVAIIAVAGTTVSISMRRRRLRERFGPEYDRLISGRGNRRLAEAELSSRERRVAGFSLRPLGDDAYDQFTTRWAQVQEKFVESPTEAVADAQALVEEVMRERGYPTDDYERQLEDLSVEHSAVLAHFRSAHASSQRAVSGAASTEEPREAMISYRELFDQLLSRDAGTAAADADVTPKVRPDDSIPGEVMPEREVMPDAVPEEEDEPARAPRQR